MNNQQRTAALNCSLENSKPLPENDSSQTQSALLTQSPIALNDVDNYFDCKELPVAAAIVADIASPPRNLERLDEDQSQPDAGEAAPVVSCINPKTVAVTDQKNCQKIVCVGASKSGESPKKRRRSERNVHRIQLWERSSLARRRFDNLFSDSSRKDAAPMRIGKWSLEQVHSSPNVYVVDNFLASSDLEYLRSCIESMPFQRSYVDNPESMERLYDTTHRTSTFLSFDKQQDSKVAAIEQRAATLMGCFSTGSVEALQLVRYQAGQFFGVHHDLGDYNDETNSVELPPKQVYVQGCKRRLVTIFCYLNDVEKGGQTHFPALDLAVQPQAGRAVVWQNILPTGEPDARTIHAGLPVEEGVKYALNIWLCEE